MFSNDRNIETIGQLVELVKHYIGLQTKYLKLDVIEKTVRVVTVITMTMVLSLILLLVLIFLSFALVYVLSPLVGTAAGYAIIASVYFLMFILCIIFRKRWIERPLVRFLAGILINK